MQISISDYLFKKFYLSSETFPVFDYLTFSWFLFPPYD